MTVGCGAPTHAAEFTCDQHLTYTHTYKERGCVLYSNCSWRIGTTKKIRWFNVKRSRGGRALSSAAMFFQHGEKRRVWSSFVKYLFTRQDTKSWWLLIRRFTVKFDSPQPECRSISGSHLFGYNAMILWRFSAAESVELSMLMLLSNATIVLIIALSNPAGEHLHL